MARHLGYPKPGDVPQRGARLLVHIVVAAEVAGIVVGEERPHLLAGSKATLLHQAGQELGVVDDLEAAAVVRVLVAQRVEAVGAGRHDLGGAGGGQRLNVLLRQLLEEELVPDAPSRVTVAQLAGAEDAEADPGPLEQADEGPGDLLRAVVERRGAADPVQVLGGLPVLDDPHPQPLGPICSRGLRHAPRVLRALQVA